MTRDDVGVELNDGVSKAIIIAGPSHGSRFPPISVALIGREMGPRLFQGNRSVGEILFHLARIVMKYPF